MKLFICAVLLSAVMIAAAPVCSEPDKYNWAMIPFYANQHKVDSMWTDAGYLSHLQ